MLFDQLMKIMNAHIWQFQFTVQHALVVGLIFHSSMPKVFECIFLVRIFYFALHIITQKVCTQKCIGIVFAPNKFFDLKLVNSLGKTEQGWTKKHNSKPMLPYIFCRQLNFFIAIYKQKGKYKKFPQHQVYENMKSILQQ